jgi:hypothetical protein
MPYQNGELRLISIINPAHKVAINYVYDQNDGSSKHGPVPSSDFTSGSSVVIEAMV